MSIIQRKKGQKELRERKAWNVLFGGRRFEFEFEFGKGIQTENTRKTNGGEPYCGVFERQGKRDSCTEP